MTRISHSRRLRNKIERVLPEVADVSYALLNHPDFGDLYIDFAVTVHQMIRATVPLMRTALERCRELAEHDPVAAQMVPYFVHHIKEETHHDEWLLEDLEFLGVPRRDILGRMPSPTIASLAGAQYYWIHHHHPVAKLGQIAVMEGYPISIEAIDAMVEKSGHPRRVFRTFEKHCHLDPHHRDEFNVMLDSLPLTEQHHRILGVSALHTVDTANRAYREVLECAAPALC